MTTDPLIPPAVTGPLLTIGLGICLAALALLIYSLGVEEGRADD